MKITPTLTEFLTATTPQLVSTKFVSDLETPVSAFMKIARDEKNAFLLESVEGGAVRGRYSMIGLSPDILWKVENNKASINRSTTQKSFTEDKQHPLNSLRNLLKESRLDIPEHLPPMAAGVFGLLGYDMVRLMENLPNTPPDKLNIPDSLMVRPTILVIFDAVKDEMTLVTPVRDGNTKANYDKAVNRLIAVLDRLETPLPKQDTSEYQDIALTSNTSPSAYSAMVDKAKEYILAGDIFQVVLSQRFSAPFKLPPFSLYRALRRVNPSPFLYYLNFDGFALAGSSPEILVRVKDGKVTIRPIAGTRPRGATREEDKRLSEELLNDQKECAEHLMLLDLGRNDVGRVSKIGSVKVTDKFFVEHYSHVMHIVSNVEGDLDDKYDAIDALQAGFPAGTVSGAPKVRAMEIIDELEIEKRNAYAGCVGYFSANGDMDTCIVLRTALIKDEVLYVQAGAGIVADSVNESEQQECVNKAKAIVRAAEEAVRFSQSKRGQ